MSRILSARSAILGVPPNRWVSPLKKRTPVRLSKSPVSLADSQSSPFSHAFGGIHD